jgi:hypothetical protein
VTASCATGYAGSAAATACTAAGKYALAGCAPFDCTQPADTTGFANYLMCDLDVSTDGTADCPAGCANVAGLDATTCADTDAGGNATPATDGTSTCDLDVSTDGTAECPAGCTTDGVVASCTGTPTELTETSLASTNFDVAAVCDMANGYVGTAVATACTAAGEYTLSGCTALDEVCSAPAPDDMTGYVVVEEELASQTFDVTASCAPGYTGTARSSVCTAQDASSKARYGLSGCTRIDCTAPVDTTGYTVTNTDLSVAEFDVTVVCDTDNALRFLARSPPTSPATPSQTTTCAMRRLM